MMVLRRRCWAAAGPVGGARDGVGSALQPPAAAVRMPLTSCTPASTAHIVVDRIGAARERVADDNFAVGPISNDLRKMQ